MIRGFPSLARNTLPLTLAALLGAVPALAAPTCPDVPNGARVDVTFDGAAGTLAVSPDPIRIYSQEGPQRPGQVCWMISGLSEGQTLHVDGKEGQQEAFRNRETTARHPRTKLLSGRPSRTGSWLYDVWVTDESGKVLATLDPEVIIDY